QLCLSVAGKACLGQNGSDSHFKEVIPIDLILCSQVGLKQQKGSCNGNPLKRFWRVVSSVDGRFCVADSNASLGHWWQRAGRLLEGDRLDLADEIESLDRNLSDDLTQRLPGSVVVLRARPNSAQG